MGQRKKIICHFFHSPWSRSEFLSVGLDQIYNYNIIKNIQHTERNCLTKRENSLTCRLGVSEIRNISRA